MADLNSPAVEVVVTVGEPYLQDVAEIAAALEGAGLGDCQVLASIGVITGRASRDVLPRLQGVRGVQAVELSGEVWIPPPDAPIQ